MTYEALFEFFYWSAIFNVIILAWWSVWIMAGSDFIYKMHSKWFKMDREAFNRLHYTGLMIYKIVIIIFNIVPLLALWKMGGF